MEQWTIKAVKPQLPRRDTNLMTPGVLHTDATAHNNLELNCSALYKKNLKVLFKRLAITSAKMNRHSHTCSYVFLTFADFFLTRTLFICRAVVSKCLIYRELMIDVYIEELMTVKSIFFQLQAVSIPLNSFRKREQTQFFKCHLNGPT